jgi:hypothetical protein
LKSASEAVSIATVTKTKTVLKIVSTSSVQSQQSTSAAVTVVAVATTLLMAGQIFRDFLILTHSKKLPIHESIKKNCKSQVKEWRDAARVDPHHQDKGGGVSPRSVQRYTQCASGLVDTSLGDANVTVRDKFLKRVASNIGPSLVK